MEIRTLNKLNKDLSIYSLFDRAGTVTNELLYLAKKGTWKYSKGKYKTTFKKFDKKPCCLCWYITKYDSEGAYKQILTINEYDLNETEKKQLAKLNKLFSKMYDKETNQER